MIDLPAISFGDATDADHPPVDPAVAPLLRGLDRAQRAAVMHEDGPLLIVAGAGTGKTRVITRRIAWLIATRRARPSEILALTFTDRAADEMQARVDQLVPYGYVDTAIHTFHAFGDRLIREFAFELGLPSDPRVLTRAEAVVFLRERLFQLDLDRYRPLGDPTRFLHALVGVFSRAKDEDIDPARYLAHAQALADAAARTPTAPVPDAEEGSGSASHGVGGSRAERDPDVRRDPQFIRAWSEERQLGTADHAAQEEAAGHLEVARAYERYQEMLAEAGCLDFGDQVHMALRLLREHPAALERLRRRYRYILVDEFQDTNRAQLELLAHLAGPHGNLTVVGDDDQAIYAFRGAAVRNILEFRARFGARVVVLRRNHRSRAPILEAARRLIRHNDPARLEVREGLDKRLVAVRRARRPLPVRHHAFATSADEADFLAATIARRLASGVEARDIAVLVRANADADPVLRALNLQGIPWRFSGASGLYATPSVRRLLAFLRTVANPDSTVDLYAVAAAEPYGLGGIDLARFLEAARRTHRSLWAVLEDVANGGTAAGSADTRVSVERLVTDLHAALELSADKPAGEVLYDFLRRSGTLATLAAGGPEVGTAVLDVARFFEIVRRQSDLLPDPRAPFLAPHLRTLVDAGDDVAAASDDDRDVVSVLTVHKAKGLEFRVVFVAGLVDGRFPMRNRREALTLPGALDASGGASLEPDDGLAEERRLCYVAMTRARDELVLTSAWDTGGRRRRRVSPFVAEALDLPSVVLPGSAPEGGGTAAIERFRATGASPAVRPGNHAPAVVSFTQIDDYLSCPARYRYRHVLRLPTQPHHALSYGIALHEAVAAFGRSQIQGRPLSESGLLDVFARSWSGLGFLSRDHEEARRASGTAALIRFRNAALRSRRRPLAVEEPFSVTVDGTRFQGRFDRVDQGAHGVVITDFKSSDVRDATRARERARDSLQLALYALAWQAREGALPAATELAFLDSGVTGTVEPDPARLANAAARMHGAVDAIRAADFTARPDAVGCRFCPFREICPSSLA